LVFTCTGVSFAHGSNDGQKGMGLIVLILVGIVPAGFALNLQTSADTLAKISASGAAFEQSLQKSGVNASLQDDIDANKTLTTYLRKGAIAPETMPALEAVNRRVMAGLADVSDLAVVPGAQRRILRLNVYLVSETLAKMIKAKKLPATLDADALSAYQKNLKGVTSFIPVWVKVAIALALGLGTMVGWKRIVVTVGEKIGKAHLTYGQGAAAEIVAFGTIEAADMLGLPVSTTHILSSGIAGTMVANGSGIQGPTVRNIILAWVLTLPVCVILGAALFGAGLLFVFRVLGVQ
jgi:PiT family inorganic phosphate transporter